MDLYVVEMADLIPAPKAAEVAMALHLRTGQSTYELYKLLLKGSRLARSTSLEKANQFVKLFESYGLKVKLVKAQLSLGSESTSTALSTPLKLGKDVLLEPKAEPKLPMLAAFLGITLAALSVALLGFSFLSRNPAFRLPISLSTPNSPQNTISANLSPSYTVIDSRDSSFWVIKRRIDYVSLPEIPGYEQIAPLTRSILLDLVLQDSELDGLTLYLYGPANLAGERLELAKAEWKHQGDLNDQAIAAQLDKRSNYGLTVELMSRDAYLTYTLRQLTTP
ncbi:MAG: hypothetical protein KC422_04445 [Trueperaceae bacterium]|nr:hypothetical protein [Trueperaceae bacterium]